MQGNSHNRELNVACCKFEKSQKIILVAKELKHFCNFKVVNGKLVANREDRIKWNVDGAKEFKSLFEVICNLPHIRALADADDTLQLFPHRSDIVFNRLKVTLERWFCLAWEVALICLSTTKVVLSRNSKKAI